jgi:hypothetical protein
MNILKQFILCELVVALVKVIYVNKVELWQSVERYKWRGTTVLLLTAAVQSKASAVSDCLNSGFKLHPGYGICPHFLHLHCPV